MDSISSFSVEFFLQSITLGHGTMMCAKISIGGRGIGNKEMEVAVSSKNHGCLPYDCIECLSVNNTVFVET
jgi:hypothetical protein